MLGSGSWGTALALHLSRQGHQVNLWSIEEDHVLEMQNERVNRRYIPDHPFPDELNAFIKLEDTLKDTDDIILAVPSIGFKDTLEKIKPLLKPTSRILWVTKGFDEASGQLLHKTFEDTFGEKYPYGALSGPSFALEVAKGLPTAVVIASKNAEFAKDMQDTFNSPHFRVYISSDIIGVQIGGAVKNVIAIATGISDGMKLGTNSRCAIITRGLTEVTRLGVALGGKPETFTGLSGLGDLVLTCTDNQSRNRRFGLELSKGTDVEAAIKSVGQVVEGARNSELVVNTAKEHNIEMPIAEVIAKIVSGEITSTEAMQSLLARKAKPE